MYYYRIFVNERGNYIGHPSPLAPDFTEFETPVPKHAYRTATAIWCNLMEDHLDYFRRCEENNTLVTMVVYQGNRNESFGLKKIITICNIPIERDGYKVVTLNDIDY